LDGQFLQDRSFDNTLDGAKDLLQSFYDSKITEKGQNLTDRMDFKAL
jgi:hypothetical protein